MYQLPLKERTVGVVARDDAMFAGYTLFNASRESYLIDEDGQMVHMWRARRDVFVSYLLPSGHLLRDGAVPSESPGFQSGGAGGVVEEVTWDNEPCWCYDFYPYQQTLAHHDLEPLPNGHVLVLCWERKTKQQALDAGRRPDLIPDGEVWNNLVIELKPEGTSARIVWQWSMWDHIIQDLSPQLANFGDIFEHPELFDINFCPVGGKNAQRNRALLKKEPHNEPSGLSLWKRNDGQAGEKDWLHINSVSYDQKRDQLMLCVHLSSELIIIDHGTTTQEACGHSGGKKGKGGDILYRFGNPAACRRGTMEDQRFFCPHSMTFLDSGNVLVFNNGRAPDRLFSTVEEYELPDADGQYNGEAKMVWSYGERQGRANSFYCTNISGAQRLANGNSLITMGPQGIIFEVTAEGREVWRYVSPVLISKGAVATVRQGDFRTEGRFSLFVAKRYAKSFEGLKTLKPLRYLEAV